MNQEQNPSVLTETGHKTNLVQGELAFQKLVHSLMGITWSTERLTRVLLQFETCGQSLCAS